MQFPIDAVVFDLDDTLFDDAASFRGAATHIAELLNERYGTDVRHVVDVYISELEKFWERLTSRDVGTPIVGMRALVWSRTLERCGIADDLGEELAERYNVFRRPSFVLWPGVVEMLAELRARGAKLAILTNGLRETHREKIDLLKIEPLVDAVYISDEVGMVKPDPRIFELVCTELGVAPGRATMVGDRYSRDVIGAQAVGMKTIWLDLGRDPMPEGAEPPDATVPTIQAASALLLA